MYEEIYKMLEELIEGFQFMPDYLKLKAPGFMDLNVHKLGVGIIALFRYCQNSSGHRIADPDMEIKLDHQNKTAEVLTYQDSSTGKGGGLKSFCRLLRKKATFSSSPP